MFEMLGSVMVEGGDFLLRVYEGELLLSPIYQRHGKRAWTGFKVLIGTEFSDYVRIYEVTNEQLSEASGRLKLNVADAFKYNFLQSRSQEELAKIEPKLNESEKKILELAKQG